MQVNPPGLPGIGDGPPPPQITEVGDAGRCGCDPFLRLSWVVLITNTVQNLLCLARANYRHQQFDVTVFLVSTQWRYLRTVGTVHWRMRCVAWRGQGQDKKAAPWPPA